jgi:uncharacterized protein involved in exopolysaccharide biosynthesis
MSKREILVFLFRRKWSLITVMLSVVTLVTLFVYVLPTSYTAVAKVLLEPTKSPTLGTESRYGSDAGEVLYTEIEIVLSRTVMETVVDKLKLHERGGAPGPVARFIAGVKAALVEVGLLDPPEPRESWIRDLLRDVKVKPVLDTHVFTISYSDQNPVQAAEVANAITDEYMNNHTRIYSYEGAVDFYRSSAEQARKEADRLRQAQSAGGGGAPLPSRRDAAVLEATQLEGRLGLLRLEHQDVLARYTPDHPKVAAILRKVDLVTRQLAAARLQVSRMEIDKDRGDTLQPLIEGQLEAYRSYRKQYDQALLTSAAARRLINAHVLDRAAVPTRPRFPRLVYVLASVLGGLLLGLAVALIRQYYDHRIDTPDAAERILGAPVIGSVPKVWRLRP